MIYTKAFTFIGGGSAGGGRPSDAPTSGSGTGRHSSVSCIGPNCFTGDTSGLKLAAIGCVWRGCAKM
ncbi:EsV-1-202 [Ectocarpus siliculosus virus 1]|uniref:EsV-1-202 n=1 Tax=Ectocarpus siliculosus virus 1 (isolate New Zealand/Kaikoura/1988) TaxID=654926 RepID=Q8QN87_ESV1K|nr:EsV-1-202 [Ectocarpus siliculosus virus 1]AAK14616.1 EsV-1-202 [Ectocarpus siliculosus virus 1]